MIRIEKTDEGLALFFKERRVFTHSSKNPWLTVGRGTGNYKMSHGLFRIRETIQEKRPLSSCKISGNSNEEASLDFGDTLVAECAVRGGRLEISFQCRDESVNRVWMRLDGSPGEAIFGCGEQFSRLNLKGLDVPIWCQEQGVGRGRDLITFLADLTHGAGGAWHTTYFPQPTFVSTANYFCHLETSAYARFDFRKTRHHTLYVWGVPDTLVFDAAENAPDVLKSLTGHLGRQPALPEWAYNGVWLGVQGGKEIVAKKLKDALDAGVRVAAVWAQDWEGRRITSFGKQLMWNWRFDEEMYPDLPGYIRELGEKGIRFLGYINPFLALEKELYKEASEKGYLVKKSDGEEYHVVITTFPAAVLDLSNPEAVEWIKGVIKKNMIGIGLSGWMADFGEYLPVDAVLASGESAELFHNRYPALWARANAEAVLEAGTQGEVAFFMRAGYTGSSRHASLVWAGDQLVNWSMDDGLATVIPAGISMGYSGTGLHHSDIGGYTTVAWIRRSKELFMRWAEHAAFTAVMRTHEGNRPDSNWQFNSDAETLAHYARMSRVYAHLKPYIRAAVEEYASSGVPVMRHPCLHYENDAKLRRIKYQYLLGRDLMVAPVIKPGKKRWDALLPEDNWIHLWSGEHFRGGWYSVAAPPGEPPVFYRPQSAYAPLFRELRDLK